MTCPPGERPGHPVAHSPGGSDHLAWGSRVHPLCTPCGYGQITLTFRTGGGGKTLSSAQFLAGSKWVPGEEILHGEAPAAFALEDRSEEHTSELQSLRHL